MKEEETTQDTGLSMEILGPAWQVGLCVRDAPCLARSGPGWAAEGDEGGRGMWRHPFCARYLRPT